MTDTFTLNEALQPLPFPSSLVPRDFPRFILKNYVIFHSVSKRGEIWMLHSDFIFLYNKAVDGMQ